MNGEIAQIVALTCHVKAFLKGKEIGDFFPYNSTCKFIESIKFVDWSKNVEEDSKEVEELASTPDKWFEYLKSKKANGIRVSRIPQSDEDRWHVGFVGQGGIWEIEAVYENKTSSIWRPKWEIGDQDALDKRIWRLTYGTIGTISSRSLEPGRVYQIRNNFLIALKEIEEFSIKNKCDEIFTSSFQKAIETLESKKDEKKYEVYHEDLCPKSFCAKDNISILNACQHAYVFGGMGTWNDLWLENDVQDEYNRVSDNLFSILMDMIIATTNLTYYK